MAFLRTLLWIALTVIVVVFSVRNWVPVPVNLFGDTIVETKLPMLLLIAFLAGFLPVYIWHRVFRWRQARKAAALDQPPPIVPSPAPVPVAPPSADPFQAD